MGDPLQHCALNVALYGRRKRWAMTERTRPDVERSASTLVIGPSAISWDGSSLIIAIDEIAFPFPGRIRGKVRVIPSGITSEAIALDQDTKHWWQPIAPCGRIEIAASIAQRSDGRGTATSIATSDASRWRKRSKAGIGRVRTILAARGLYDLERRDGTALSLARHFGRDGSSGAPIMTAPFSRLPITKWLVPRATRADPDATPKVIKTLEDTPFYARSLIETTLDSCKISAMHESLSLDRLANPLVRLMLPFRMPRWAHRRPSNGGIDASEGGTL